MIDAAQHNTGNAAQDQRPAVRLAGLFVGFASVSLTLGTYWPFAPLFPAIVAAIAALLPIKGHVQFAKGALAALLGVVVFEALFAVLFILLS